MLAVEKALGPLAYPTHRALHLPTQFLRGVSVGEVLQLLDQPRQSCELLRAIGPEVLQLSRTQPVNLVDRGDDLIEDDAQVVGIHGSF